MSNSKYVGRENLIHSAIRLWVKSRWELLLLKILPQKPEPILLAQIFAKLTSLGRIHPLSTSVEPS
ncbi:hypothetical protein [Nostoc sp.]